jgi:flagellar biosynthesis anti-sigma factor FlgM
MRIDLSAGLPLAEADASRTRSSRPPSNDEAAGQTEAATTSSSTSVRSLAQSVLGAPEVRTEKVAALRENIASGRYEVSAQQIAASMLQHLLAPQ